MDTHLQRVRPSSTRTLRGNLQRLYTAQSCLLRCGDEVRFLGLSEFLLEKGDARLERPKGLGGFFESHCGVGLWEVG